MRRVSIGVAVLAVVLLRASTSWASCPGSAGCTNCEHAYCTSEGLWECLPLSAGTACHSGDACMANTVCDGAGTCGGGTPTCVPGAPGSISGASTTTTGSVSLS